MQAVAYSAFFSLCNTSWLMLLLLLQECEDTQVRLHRPSQEPKLGVLGWGSVEVG